jgi:hypothetical protein
MMSPDELAGIVRDRSREVDGRRILTCAEALSLAREFGVEPGQIGCICNQEKIRLGSCQLGCFS